MGHIINIISMLVCVVIGYIAGEFIQYKTKGYSVIFGVLKDKKDERVERNESR